MISQEGCLSIQCTHQIFEAIIVLFSKVLMDEGDHQSIEEERRPFGPDVRS